MNKLLEAFTKNTITVFIGWLATIIALFITVAIPIIQARKIQLGFLYGSNTFVSDSLSKLDGLEVSYRGSKVGRLTITTCLISNTGNVTIEDSDVYEDHKLSVFTESENAEILFASVMSQSSDTNNCQVSYDRNSVNVHFDVLEKNEEVVFNIYHTGEDDTVFSIEGKIKEGKITEGQFFFNSSSRLHFLRMLVVMMIVATIFSMFAYFQTGFQDRMRGITCILILITAIFFALAYSI